MRDTNDMKPDWISPPGDTILDLLDERGWTKTDLVHSLGYTQERICGLLDGTAAITAEIARKLAQVLGSTEQFWLNRESHYRASVESLNPRGVPHA